MPAKSPKPAPHSFYGRPLPEVTDARFSGKLLVLEGADGSGRSTQIQQLSAWLEGSGYAVRHMGLRRSPLLAQDIEHAKQSTVLTHTTMSLFYATDFFDQLIHEIIPALRAGYIVLADRYIYTAFARDVVRGVDPAWVELLYSFAVPPDLTLYFRAPLETALARILDGRPPGRNRTAIPARLCAARASGRSTARAHAPPAPAPYPRD